MTAVTFRLIVLPAQYAPVLVGAGVAGIALTTTVVVPAALVQPLTVMVKLYTPLIVVVALAIVGFCTELLKLLGPVQL